MGSGKADAVLIRPSAANCGTTGETPACDCSQRILDRHWLDVEYIVPDLSLLSSYYFDNVFDYTPSTTTARTNPDPVAVERNPEPGAESTRKTASLTSWFERFSCRKRSVSVDICMASTCREKPPIEGSSKDTASGAGRRPEAPFSRGRLNLSGDPLSAVRLRSASSCGPTVESDQEGFLKFRGRIQI